MSETTPNLNLPFIMPAQAQKHVTHNEAIELLDAIVQLMLESSAATTPPLAPLEGQAWAVGDVPSGDWAGYADSIAAWRGGGWLFVVPREGWLAWVKGDAALQVFTGTQWDTLAATGP